MINEHNEVMGTGARAYLQTFFERGMASHEIYEAIAQLKVEAAQDKRVKQCEYCGGYWFDDSLRNTRNTCCDECKTGIKTLQRRKQREKKELTNPTSKSKKRKIIDDYVHWLDYPYWLDEYSMLKHSWREEVPQTVETIDFVKVKHETLGEGNRRKGKSKGAD